MLDLSIRIDASAVIAALDRVSDQRELEGLAGYVADQVVLPALMKYPSPSGKAQPFASAASRRFFFAALKSGRLQVPYRRSGNLGAHWAKQPFSGGMTLQSTEDYSEIVIGENQAKYFKGTWPSVTQTALACEADAALAATAYLVQLIGDAGP